MPSTSKPWKFYAAPMSYFSAKVRPALRYKKIAFDEVWATADVYKEVLIPRTGLAFIPVIITDEDEVLQDTPRMIARIEELFPEPAIYPADPAVRMIAEVIQDFADDGLIAPAMHYRWSFPEQRPWIENDWTALVGDAAKDFAARMAATLPVLGVCEQTIPAIQAWYGKLLDLLSLHFEGSRFILGDVLTLADLALAGPFYAHLGRDPVPARIMRERAPRVMAWLHETNDAAPPAPGAGPPQVRDTLLPLLAEIGEVFVPMQQACVEFADANTTLNSGDKAPRALGMTEQPLPGGTVSRFVNTYSLYRQQQSAQRYAGLSEADRERVDALLGLAGVLPYLQHPAKTDFVMDGLVLHVA